MKKIIIVLVCLIILLSISACSIRGRASDSNYNLNVSTEQHNDTNTEEESNTSSLFVEKNAGKDVSTEADSFIAFGGSTTFKLLESGEFYELYGQANGTGIYYKIWNKKAELIDFGFYEKGNQIVQNGNLLEYSMSGGVYNRWVKYFDIYNSRVSRFFNNPLATKENLVVYTDFVDDVHCVIIQNIFDPTVFYKVITMDPAPDSAVQFEVAFVDNQHIQLKYSSKNGTVTQVYNIG